MIYVVKKRAGVWTVATDKFLLSFENYDTAIEVAQGAAGVLRRRGRTRLASAPLTSDTRWAQRHLINTPNALDGDPAAPLIQQSCGAFG
jgi:hypothetical protein